MNYEWFEKKSIQRIDSPKGRRYKTPEGNYYESVTTFLGRQDPDKFKAWENAIGIDEANKVRARAAARGTLLHSLVEQHLLGQEVDFGKNILIKNMFNRFKPIIKRIETLNALEYPLYSDTLQLAGTVDAIGTFDGTQSIIDFKTSNGSKSANDILNYWLQTTIYSLAVEELYSIKIPNLVILIAVEDEPPQVFRSNRKQYLPILAELIKRR